MLSDLVSRFTCDGFDKRVKIIALEQRSFATLPAQQQMFMAGWGSDEGLASMRLVDALDQSLMLERFEGSVHCNQPERGMG
jgi:hypothetical protein